VKTTRGMRILRIISIMRMAKTGGIMENVLGPQYHEIADGFLRLIEAVTVILLAMHFIACMWYALGTAGAEHTWLLENYLEEATLLYRYSTSIHWAITQCTPASMEVHPVNAIERSFAVIVDLAGLIVFSTFISTITTRMTQLRTFGYAVREERKLMRNYFKNNHISLHLGIRIMNFAKSLQHSKKARTNRDDISVMVAMPERLRKELDSEVFSPILCAHALFNHLFMMNSSLIREISASAVNDKVLVAKEELFTRKGIAPCMYFFISGTLEYRLDGRKVSCTTGTCASEAAVWIQDYMHRGVMTALAPCEVVCLDATLFRRLICKCMKSSQPHIRMLASFAVRYAVRFLSFEDGDSDLKWTDVGPDLHSISSLVDSIIQQMAFVNKQASLRQRTFSRFSLVSRSTLSSRQSLQSLRHSVRSFRGSVMSTR